MSPARLAWRVAGLGAIALGIVGIVLPLLPTVPFMLLAAWCFAKGNPAWEQRLLAHPRYGPHIRAWREQRAISRPGKIAAMVAFTASAAIGLWWLDGPWQWLPLGVGAAGAAFILTRPTARF